jgi:hypothetical protein
MRARRTARWRAGRWRLSRGRRLRGGAGIATSVAAGRTGGQRSWRNGRRAALRSLWARARGGSNPLDRTRPNGQLPQPYVRWPRVRLGLRMGFCCVYDLLIMAGNTKAPLERTVITFSVAGIIMINALLVVSFVFVQKIDLMDYEDYGGYLNSKPYTPWPIVIDRVKNEYPYPDLDGVALNEAAKKRLQNAIDENRRCDIRNGYNPRLDYNSHCFSMEIFCSQARMDAATYQIPLSFWVVQRCSPSHPPPTHYAGPHAPGW